MSNLLACDPARRSPLTWEIDDPVPPATSATLKTDPRAAARLAAVERKRLKPSTRNLENITEIQPFIRTECIFFYGA